MLAAVTVAEAAAELGVSERQLRRWLRAGCPVARRGRRGRGGAALLDVDAVQAWRRQATAEDALATLAGAVPELVADAVHASFLEAEGVRKSALAGVLCAVWYRVAASLLDQLGADAPAEVPHKIARLRHIKNTFGKLV